MIKYNTNCVEFLFMYHLFHDPKIDYNEQKRIKTNRFNLNLYQSDLLKCHKLETTQLLIYMQLSSKLITLDIISSFIRFAVVTS